MGRRDETIRDEGNPVLASFRGLRGKALFSGTSFAVGAAAYGAERGLDRFDLAVPFNGEVHQTLSVLTAAALAAAVAPFLGMWPNARRRP